MERSAPYRFVSWLIDLLAVDLERHFEGRLTTGDQTYSPNNTEQLDICYKKLEQSVSGPLG